MARRSAPTRSRARAKSSAGPQPRSKCPPTCAAWRKAGERSKPARQAWLKRLAALAPDTRAEFERRIRGELPADKLAAAVRAVKEKLAAAPKEIATRVASESALEALVAAVPEMIGGSADLTGSNNTRAKGMTVLSAADYAGRFIHYGVREHGMAAAMNGMALHGGIIPVFRHVPGVLRLLPPGDPARRADGPARHPRDDARFHRARRGRPDPPAGRAPRGVARDPEPAGVPALRRGRDGRVLAARARSARPPERARAHAPEPAAAAAGASKITTVAPPAPTRSFRRRTRTPTSRCSRPAPEVSIAVEARKFLRDRGVSARVVSVPCFELFRRCRPPNGGRSSAMRRCASASRPRCARAGTRSSAPDGAFVGMTTFGASAPYKDLYKQFGITAEKGWGEGVAEAALGKSLSKKLV